MFGDTIKNTDHKGKSPAKSEQKSFDAVKAAAKPRERLVLDPRREYLKGGMEHEGSSGSNEVREKLNLLVSRNKEFMEKKEGLMEFIKKGETSSDPRIIEMRRQYQKELDIMNQAEKEHARRSKSIRDMSRDRY